MTIEEGAWVDDVEEGLCIGDVEEVELCVDWDGGLLPGVVGGRALLHYKLLRVL